MVEREGSRGKRSHVLFSFGLIVKATVHLDNVAASLAKALSQQRRKLTLSSRVGKKDLTRIEEQELRQRDGVVERISKLRENELGQMHVERREPNLSSLVLAYRNNEDLVYTPFLSMDD